MSITTYDRRLRKSRGFRIRGIRQWIGSGWIRHGGWYKGDLVRCIMAMPSLLRWVSLCGALAYVAGCGDGASTINESAEAISESATSCAVGSSRCGRGCVNLTNDARNCGACGHACPSGSKCAAGLCSSVCAAGTVRCGNSCVDTATDPLDCGACGQVCPSGGACSAGLCQ